MINNTWRYKDFLLYYQKYHMTQQIESKKMIQWCGGLSAPTGSSDCILFSFLLNLVSFPMFPLYRSYVFSKFIDWVTLFCNLSRALRSCSKSLFCYLQLISLTYSSLTCDYWKIKVSRTPRSTSNYAHF